MMVNTIHAWAAEKDSFNTSRSQLSRRRDGHEKPWRWRSFLILSRRLRFSRAVSSTQSRQKIWESVRAAEEKEEGV